MCLSLDTYIHTLLHTPHPPPSHLYYCISTLSVSFSFLFSPSRGFEPFNTLTLDPPPPPHPPRAQFT